jgi:hypothetical protein
MVQRVDRTPCKRNDAVLGRYLGFLILLFILCTGIPACEASGVTIAVYPVVCQVGEQIVLSGTTTMENTIAVYLFLIGPELDPRGVTLENLNLPAGQGYFTSARVSADGSWEYEWNTGLIAGRLIPGTYTIYVINVPLGMDRMPAGDSSSVNVTFIETQKTPPLGPPCAAIAMVALAAAASVARKRE